MRHTFPFHTGHRKALFLLSAIALTAALLLTPQNSSGQDSAKPPRDLYGFLKTYIRFSKKDFKNLKSKGMVIKLLDSDVRREVPVFGIMHLDLPMRSYLSHLFKDGLLIETTNVLAAGKFSNPPSLDDIRNLTFSPKDVEALRDCKVGDCDIKLTEKAIHKIHSEIDWSAPGAERKALNLVKNMMINYIRDYLKRGNNAMAVYHDKKYSLRMSKEFHSLLMESPYLYSYQPHFHDYLEYFPLRKMQGIKDFIYWVKEDIGADRQVFSIEHITLFEPDTLKIARTLIASKQIYASHYFEASFGITALAPDPDGNPDFFYLIYLNRSRIDTLRKKYPLGIVRKKIRKGVVNLVRKKFEQILINAERLAE